MLYQYHYKCNYFRQDDEDVLDKFTIITPVWGTNHIELFLRICIPSLLAKDNLPTLSSLSKVNYLVYTLAEDVIVIEGSETFQRLKQTIDVELISFSRDTEIYHHAMTWCHQQGFKRAVQDRSYAVFIPPDCIWNNRFLLSLYNIVSKGFKIIQMSGLRVIKEQFCDALHKKYGTNLDLESGNLVDVALRFLHPITESHFFDERQGRLLPANLLWSVGDNCILARNFHLHPILVDAIGLDINFDSTIDDDLALVFNSRNSEEYIVTDSDELVTFEISPLQYSMSQACDKGNIFGVASWAEYNTNSRHRVFIKTSILIHAGPIDHISLSLITKKSDNVVTKIVNILESRKNLKFNINKFFTLRFKPLLRHKLNTIIQKLVALKKNFLSQHFYR